MTKLVDDAIASLRRDGPPESQDDVARLVMQLTGGLQPLYELTPDEKADLDAADAEIERGELSTDEEVRAVWAKHGV